MEKFTLGNAKGLKQFFDDRDVPNQITHDGWQIQIEAQDCSHVFRLGMQFQMSISAHDARQLYRMAAMSDLNKSYEAGGVTLDQFESRRKEIEAGKLSY